MHPNDLLISHFRIDPRTQKGLTKLRIESIKDLLYHFPSRYGEEFRIKPIADLVAGETASIAGILSDTKTSRAYRKKIPMGEATVKDPSGAINIVWFHQAYMAKKFPPGTPVRITGKVASRAGITYFSNPEMEALAGEDLRREGSLFGEDDGRMYPVYAESQGVSSSWIYHHIRQALSTGVHVALTDPLPKEIRERYNLPDIASAMVWIHTPKKESDAKSARKRFSFEEIFMIQLTRQHARATYRTHHAFEIPENKKLLGEFLDDFPFPPTGAQMRAIEESLSDMLSDKPMVRLVEGDVGSGKTLVAASLAYLVAHTNRRGKPMQTAYMTPTEILAKQHFTSFQSYFKKTGMSVGLLLGSGAYKYPSKIGNGEPTKVSRAQLLKWLISGEMPFVVGTHALITQSVKFANLALVVIDEQHRFGIRQRAKLVQKEGSAPHLLSMTATPIPRTLALTMYGDLDLSVIDELPKGRKPVKTEIVPPQDRPGMYARMIAHLKEGRQAYIICPRVHEPDPEKELALQAKSATAEAKRLATEELRGYRIGVLHGKQKPSEKEAVMRDFESGKYHVLVATSVVEVGVNVPNATVISIEGADRFGLAQLHQLRGRVARSSHQATCFLATEAKQTKGMERLKALTKANNGFELAELDLSLRGAGELSGAKQWGVSDLAMEAIQNIKMVEAARNEAKRIIASDPTLARHPLFRQTVDETDAHIHFE